MQGTEKRKPTERRITGHEIVLEWRETSERYNPEKQKHRDEEQRE